MLVAAEDVEAKHAKIGLPGALALAVPEDASVPPTDPLLDVTERFEELDAAIGFRQCKPFNKSKVQCYKCERLGHFQNKFPYPRIPPK